MFHYYAMTIRRIEFDFSLVDVNSEIETTTIYIYLYYAELPLGKCTVTANVTLGRIRKQRLITLYIYIEAIQDTTNMKH